MKKVALLLGLATLIVLSSCTTTPPKKPGTGPWSGKMQELSQVLSSLYPYVWSREEFFSEKNAPEISKKIKHLSDLAHNVNDKSKSESPDADPAIKFLAQDFDDDITRAHDAFNNGSKEYSRQVLGTATNHCINCHSRNQTGPQFQTLNLNFDFEKLNPFVRAEAYMATRQFKKAADEYSLLTTRRDYINNYPFEVQRALKKGLAIQVRVLDSVDGAYRLIQNFLSVKELPLFLEREAKTWLRDLEEWKKEQPTLLWSQSTYTRKMDFLIGDADRRESRSEFDEPFINYLRASSLGHLYLSKYKNDPNLSDVLFKMGVIYETLDDLGYWTLSENYYNQCIRQKPHSPIAVRCLYRFEEKMYLGYTGSMGTNLPPEVRAQLRELRDLAL